MSRLWHLLGSVDLNPVWSLKECHLNYQLVGPCADPLTADTPTLKLQIWT